MNPAFPSAEDRAHDLRQCERVVDRSRTHDRPRHSTRVAFFTKAEEHLGELVGGRSSNELGDWRPDLGVHPHVQRSRPAKGEATFGCIQLVGADSQVCEDPVDFGNVEMLEMGVEVREAATHRDETFAEGHTAYTGGLDGRRIAVDPNDGAVGCCQDCGSVSTPPSVQST